MTICIGTICDKGKKAILISDRMVTSESLSVQFEHESKMYQLSNNCLISQAGFGTYYEDIIEPVIGIFKKEGKKAIPRISDINEKVKEKIKDTRNKLVEETLFKPRNLTMESFYRTQTNFSDIFIEACEGYIEEFDLEISFILTGVDDNGAHLHYISDPGVSQTFTNIGFCSDGTGEPQAENSLISNHYSKNLPLKKALYLTFEAKKRAEVSPGVGKYTDVAYIDDNGCHFLSEETIKELNQIFIDKDKLIVEPTEKKVDLRIEELIIKEAYIG